MYICARADEEEDDEEERLEVEEGRLATTRLAVILFTTATDIPF